MAQGTKGSVLLMVASPYTDKGTTTFGLTKYVTLLYDRMRV